MRHQTLWPYPRLVLAVLAIGLGPHGALAQSTVAIPTTAATGRSVTDAVDQNVKDLIDREVLGTSGSGGRAGAGGVAGSASGRVRKSDHDGLTVEKNGKKGFSYDTREASVFANVGVTVPGTVLGGQLKLSGMVGHNWLSLDLKSNSTAILDPDQYASSENQSVLVGGSALWAAQGAYVVGTLVGMFGETTLVDNFDDCGPCRRHVYKYNSDGFISSLVAGKVFAMTGSPSGPMIDLRGTLGYTRFGGEEFLNINGDQQRYSFSAWTGTGAVTLFTNMQLQNNSLLRPYIQVYGRQQWDYHAQIDAVENQGPDLGRTNVNQDNTYGGVDIGFSWTMDKLSVGAATYYEASGDERTLGGRLRLNWTLN